MLDASNPWTTEYFQVRSTEPAWLEKWSDKLIRTTFKTH